MAAGDIAPGGLHATVRRYLDKYPSADAEAIETNLALTLTFMAAKDALTDYLVPYGLGLTRAQYNFLAILHLADDKKRPLSEIAREMSVTPTYITKLLDALEAEKLVERVASPADRRVTYAHLTPEGEARCTSLVPAFLKFMEEVGEAFTPEEKIQFRELLDKYRRRAEEIRAQL